MSAPDYRSAFRILREHYTRLCDRAVTEILSDRNHAEELLDEVLENYAGKFYALSVVTDQIASHLEDKSQRQPGVCMPAQADKTEASPALPHVASTAPLRVSTVHCRADILTETINEWLAKHSNMDVVSINFTQLGSGLSCVILHRLK
ncbi:MAG: hypothetical protein HY290_24270 [Planctomycetia bacterium]|nr:hypothetical protein [Planctomycetia bacterium]